MRVEVRTLSPAGEDEVAGVLRLDGGEIVAEPDSRLLRGILEEPVFDPKTGKVYGAESSPDEFLRRLYLQYNSAYLRAGKPIEDQKSKPSSDDYLTERREKSSCPWVQKGNSNFTGEKKDKLGRRYCFRDGRRVPCSQLNEGGAAPKKPAKVTPPTIDEMHKAILEARQKGLTPKDLANAAELLSRMTVKNITEVKKRLGLKASGVKAELVRKIVERALGKPAPEQKPAAEQKPEAAAAPGELPPPSHIDPSLPIADRLQKYERGKRLAEEIGALHAEVDAALIEWKETGEKMKLLKQHYPFIDSGFIQPEDRKPDGKKPTAKEKKALVEEYKELRRRNLEAQSVSSLSGKAARNKKAHDMLEKHMKDKAHIYKGHINFRHAEKGSEERYNNAINDGLKFFNRFICNGFGGPLDLKCNFGDLGPIDSDRPYYSPSRQTVFLSSRADARQAVHELGHRIDHVVPGAMEATKAFREYRCQNSPDRSLKRLFPDGSYDDGEKGNKDQFDKAFSERDAYYVGKDYADGGTEILSMGMEKLYSDPVRFAAKDPEYFAFIVGILDGSLRGAGNVR